MLTENLDKKSIPRDSCHGHGAFLSSVWQFMDAILLSLEKTWVHYYTPESKISQSDGHHVVKSHQRRQRWFHQSEWLWARYVGMHEAKSSSIPTIKENDKRRVVCSFTSAEKMAGGK